MYLNKNYIQVRREQGIFHDWFQAFPILLPRQTNSRRDIHFSRISPSTVQLAPPVPARVRANLALCLFMAADLSRVYCRWRKLEKFPGDYKGRFSSQLTDARTQKQLLKSQHRRRGHSSPNRRGPARASRLGVWAIALSCLWCCFGRALPQQLTRERVDIIVCRFLLAAVTRCESLCGALTELSEVLVSAVAAGVPPRVCTHLRCIPWSMNCVDRSERKKAAKAGQAGGLALTNGLNRCGILISFFYKYHCKESGVYRDTRTEHLICHDFMVHIFRDKLSEV